MEEKELTKEESFEIIKKMIIQAKRNYSKGDSFHWLLWGWVIMLANFGFYGLEKYTAFDKPYLIWLITIPAAIVSVYYSSRRSKVSQVINHFDRLYGQVWLAMGVSMFVTILFMSKLGYNHNGVILLFAATGTYISGQMLKFTPLILGAIALIITSVICLNVEIVDQYLYGGIGIFVGYLAPGYLLKSKESE